MKFLTLISLTMLGACSIVGPGELGVRISLGSVSDEAKVPGAYLWFPFVMGMATVDTQIQNSEIESNAASKDMQEVHAKVAVNWSLTPENAVRTYKQVGDEEAVKLRILIPAVNEVLKSATAKLTAEEVLTKRMEMKADIDKALKERLSQYGISLHDVNIVNLEFSDGFTQAIENKQIAEQQAKQAHYVADKATQDAKAEVERAKGQAEAQKLVKSTISPELLKLKAIEKWDGKLSTVSGGGVTPFINAKDFQ